MSSVDNLINELKFDLEAESEETRRHALLSLLNLPVNESIVALAENVSENDTSDQNRYIARKYLNSIKSEKAHSDEKHLSTSIVSPEAILAHGWGVNTRDAKIQALQSIIEGHYSECLGTIVSNLEKEDDNWVIASLIKAVGYIGTSSDVPVIQSYLEHSDSRVQANAVEALGAIGESLVVPLLLPMLKKKDNRIRANAVKAIYRYDKEEAFSVVRDQATSEKVWYRDSALHCISVLKDESLYPLVLEMYQSELNGDLRKKEKAFLVESGIEIPMVDSQEGTLLSDEDSALLEDDGTCRLKSMSQNEVKRRIESLLSEEDMPSLFNRISRFVPLIGLSIGVFVMVMTGYALFFGGHNNLNSLVKSVKKHLSPFSVKGCPFKGKTIKFKGMVLKYKGKPEELLIESDNRRILCTFEGVVPKEIKAGVRVVGSCEITGKTRFGSVYGKIIDIRKL